MRLKDFNEKEENAEDDISHEVDYSNLGWYQVPFPVKGTV
jgi:hypothetical protein